MPEEKTTVEQKQIGYRWHITIDRELRVANAASKQYPDKINMHASLEGHEETRQAAIDALATARTALEAATKEQMNAQPLDHEPEPVRAANSTEIIMKCAKCPEGKGHNTPAAQAPGGEKIE